MGDNSDELLETVRKIHDLLELLAEDKIAQRDAKQRAALLEMTGASAARQKAVLLMDGARTQAEIQRAVSIDQGNLSKLVSRLNEAKLIVGDTKKPRLAISVPANFFESHAKAK